MLDNKDKLDQLEILYHIRNKKLKELDFTKPLIRVRVGENTYMDMTEEEYEIRKEFLREVKQLR